jgi:hypothetical protein
MASKQPSCAIESDGTDIFVRFDGVRIAKRGSPGTPHAKTWVSLEPGYVVHDGPPRPDGGELVVIFNGVRVH